MKTLTYNNVLYRAAEAAGRVRDKIPTAEATILKSIIQEELRRLWQLADWPDLMPDLVEKTVTDNAFSKEEGFETEVGEILGIYSANPRTTTIYYELGWDEGDDTVRLHPCLDTVPETVWVEYREPAPDLLALSAEDLAAYAIPACLAPMVSLRAAAHLLTADGQPGLAGVQFGLAESALNYELARITRPPWRMRARFGR